MIRITSESIYLTKYDMILFLEMQLLKCDLLLIHNYSCFRKKDIFDVGRSPWAPDVV